MVPTASHARRPDSGIFGWSESWQTLPSPFLLHGSAAQPGRPHRTAANGSPAKATSTAKLPSSATSQPFIHG
jgi:hypothetical protein